MDGSCILLEDWLATVRLFRDRAWYFVITVRGFLLTHRAPDDVSVRK
jgi:hypothetical protein